MVTQLLVLCCCQTRCRKEFDANVMQNLLTSISSNGNIDSGEATFECMFKFPLVSILIPAYNQPSLLSRAIKSIAEQTYPNIQLVIVDDNSPVNLSQAIDSLPMKEGLSVEMYRNSTNLRPYWNLHFGRQYVKGKYLIYFPHDDYFVDTDFITNSIRLFAEDDRCKLVIANTSVENTNVAMLSVCQPEYARYVGNNYIISELWSSLHPSYSGVIFDYNYVLNKGYDSFVLDAQVQGRMGLEPDEFFQALILAAEDSNVYISGKIVSIRGNPDTSYSKSSFWAKKASESCFIPKYQIYRYFAKKEKLAEAQFFKLLLITYTPINVINFSILSSLKYSRVAVESMFISYIYCYSIGPLKNLFYRLFPGPLCIPRRALRLTKNVIRKYFLNC